MNTYKSCHEVKVKISMNGGQLNEVNSFKHLGAIIPVEESSYYLLGVWFYLKLFVGL